MDCNVVVQRILDKINEEIRALEEKCPQEFCPLSNLESGQLKSLIDLKKFIEENDFCATN